MYFSSYTDAFLSALASRLRACARTTIPVWCIFDNTAYGVATRGALDIAMLRKPR
jgi:uncharacterized protein YecE (DUF72 family)